MNLVLDDKDSILAQVDMLIDRAKSLPHNVFKLRGGHFLLMPFDTVRLPDFFTALKKCLLKINETEFIVSAIDPDPILYFEHHFKDFLGILRFSCDDNETVYIQALGGYPVTSPADALMHNGNKMVFFSSSHKWVIYADRDEDVAIFAFNDSECKQVFKGFFGVNC